MAKGRKSQYVSKLTSKDQEMLRAFRNVGYLKDRHLKDLGQRDKRIQNFVRDKYIEKCAVFNERRHTLEHVYRLTDKGMGLCRDQLDLNYFYRSNSVSHDLALAARYFELSQRERERWITEPRFRDMMKEHIENMQDRAEAERVTQMLKEHTISPIDGGYVNEQGIIISVEITTDSYGRQEIQAKQDFCAVLGVSYESYKI